MAERIGDEVPAPLRFELGQAPPPGNTARAVLLVTVGADGAPRVAVLSPAEVTVPEAGSLRIEVRSASKAAANLARGAQALVWYVLDGAAYSVCGTSRASSTPCVDSNYGAFDLTVQHVYRDFEPGAPMMAPPTYRAPSM
jgi:hypothetical protein